MTICQYWLRGNCRYGNRCRNEHPSKSEPPSTGAPTPTLIETLRSDLVYRLPEYHFSSYSNPFFPDRNLIEGDVSPEELRFRAYVEGRTTGQLTQYHAFVTQLENHCREKRETLLNSHMQPDTGRPLQPVLGPESTGQQRVFPLPSPDDVTAFGRDTFQFQHIPELPPVPELCFPC